MNDYELAHTPYIRRSCVNCVNVAISDDVGIEMGPRKFRRCLEIDISRRPFICCAWRATSLGCQAAMTTEVIWGTQTSFNDAMQQHSG